MNYFKGGIIGFVVWLVLVICQTCTEKFYTGVIVERGLLNKVLSFIGIERFGGGDMVTWVIVPIIFIVLGVIITFIFKKNRK